MKKLFIALAFTSTLWLEGCYYSRYMSNDNNYYADSSYYYQPPIVESATPQPIVVIVPQPYPVPVPSNPTVPIKYRPNTPIDDRTPSNKPDAYRNSKRDVDMNSVNVNRNTISSKPIQDGTGSRDTKNTPRSGNTNRGNEGERGR